MSIFRCRREFKIENNRMLLFVLSEVHVGLNRIVRYTNHTTTSFRHCSACRICPRFSNGLFQGKHYSMCLACEVKKSIFLSSGFALRLPGYVAPLHTAAATTTATTAASGGPHLHRPLCLPRLPPSPLYPAEGGDGPLCRRWGLQRALRRRVYCMKCIKKIACGWL